MDRLLQNEIGGESFVDRFSEKFLEIIDWDADLILDSNFDKLMNIMGMIQRYSPLERHRKEEPLLIDMNELNELTSSMYSKLKETWVLAVMQH